MTCGRHPRQLEFAIRWAISRTNLLLVYLPFCEDNQVKITGAQCSCFLSKFFHPEKANTEAQHPKVRFVLPKITPGNPQVDKILDQIRATGAIVECGSTSASQSLVPLDTLFVSMLPMASYTLTPTVNVDCTILLALVSDLSHYDAERILREAEAREPGGKLHAAVIQQLRKEDEDQLLPKLLYPLLQDHELVCTEEAAERMREIVDVIATDSEKERTAIFMGDVDQGDLHEKLSVTTIHAVPRTLKLPIKIVPANIDLARLPPVGAEVDRYFIWNRASMVTKSVFLYGYVLIGLLTNKHLPNHRPTAPG